LAKCLAPDLPTHVVGIRPGEKLHEVMVTEDDARTTIDAGDHYIIEPAFKDWAVDENARPDAKPVAENFRYSSDANSDWLDAGQLRHMIETGTQ
jgi:UDP-N-acetylglucosamine 4,6-dehydratase